MIEKQDLIDCLSFEDRLNDLIDRRFSLADDAGLVQHARCCADCAALLQDYQQLVEARPMSAGLEGEIEYVDCRSALKLRQFELPRRLPWQVRRSKLKWAMSLAPCFGALLIVMVSMLVGSGNPDGFSGIEFPRERGLGLQRVVAQSHGSTPSLRSPAQSHAYATHPFDPIVNSVFIKSGVVDGVQGYSNAIYQLANAQSRLQACNWQHDVVSNVGRPYAPIHSQVPYRGEFSAIPKFRFYLGFALRLMEMTFSGQFDLSKPDLGFQSENWTKVAMA